MANIAFTCGYCKVPTFGTVSAVSTFEDRDEGEPGFVESSWIEVAVPCARCDRLSILYFEFWLESLASQDIQRLLKRLQGEGNIVRKPSSQHPSLTRSVPVGTPHEVWSAWREAEIAYSTDQLPTISTIAYRRVLESAAKLIANQSGDDKKPLGVRLKKLNDDGIISDDLYTLTQRALSFGNAAAHEPTPLEKTDAAVARDLTEAFLRQAYTVPKLLSDAEKALEKKNIVSSKKSEKKPKPPIEEEPSE